MNKNEYNLLLAVITGDFSKCKYGKAMSKAIEGLIQKGFLRKNKYSIIEVNLSENYESQIGID